MRAVIIVALLLTNLLVYAQSGLDIIKKNDIQMKSENEDVDFVMELVNNKGIKQVRKVKQYSFLDQNNNRSNLIRFQSPADVKGTGFLSIENTGRDDDQWLFLPALNKSRRISASDETDYFMGSDFAFEDIGVEKIDENNYSLIGNEVVNGVECYVLEATPNNKKKETGYSKRVIYVSKDNSLILKTNYYNKKGDLFKVYLGEDIQPIEGTTKWRTLKMSMKNINTGHSTILLFSNYKINKGLDKNIFTQRNLESGN